MNGDACTRASEILENARHVVVLTGAGMSKESGVPTFRDALTGLWSQYDPMELATPEAFATDPGRVFRWYWERWQRARAAMPHDGHRALVRLAMHFASLTIVTQNVDGLHQRAGSDPVLELHGSLHAFRCSGAGHPWDAEARADHAMGDTADAPACETCGMPIRPGVVWFGEPLPEGAIQRAWRSVEQADAVLVVGTSSVVYPAVELPLVAQRSGASVIEINPDRTPLSRVADVGWLDRAGRALPALADRFDRRGGAE